ncbi:MAG TPA: FtsQ-type POTRA domain-containing protein, partial [Candidatus Limnocylindria bacterium]|nr:FtsQ-type POTRA domain-containing protein [Candidatus Limnocylindria bacterium]
AAGVAGLVTLVNGPWLRVARVTHAGERFTAPAAVEALLAEYVGRPLLSLASEEVSSRLAELPTVAEARVRPQLPDALGVEILEKQPAATWLTTGARLVLAADGTVIGSMARNAPVPGELARLMAVYDQRTENHGLRVGEAVAPAEMHAARRLHGLDPALLGSRAGDLSLRIDPEYGFVLVSDEPRWRAALGFYQAIPGDTAQAADARLEAQVAAVRTLFSQRREASVSWVDARNPGKVYWAP